MKQDLQNYAMDADIDISHSNESVAYLTKKNPEKSMSHKGMGMVLNQNGHALLPTTTPFIGDESECEAMVTAMVGDVDTVGYDIPSNGALQALTSIFTNVMVKQMFQTTPFPQITTSYQNGVYGNSQIFIPSATARGVSQLNADFDNAGNTNVNINWMERDIINLQRSLAYGDLQVAQMALAKVDIINQIRTFNAELIAIDINNIGFNGYEGYRTFGLLNDPSLNAVLVSPDSIANPSSSQWIYKNYLEISADVQDLYASIVGIAGGQADYMRPAYLVLPPAVYVYLTRQNALGTQSVVQYLEATFKGLEIVMAQNLQGTGTPIGAATPNYALLIYKDLGGSPVVYNAFVTPYQSHGVYRIQSYYGEVISFSIAGAFVVRAMGIARMSGI